MLCTWIVARPPKPTKESNAMKKSYMWTLSAFHPTSLITASFMWVTHNCTWVQTVLLKVWIGRGKLSVGYTSKETVNPVHPYKNNCKLMFPLYCMCRHEETRQIYTLWWGYIVWTWVVDRVGKVIEMGCSLVAMFEVCNMKLRALI